MGRGQKIGIFLFSQDLVGHMPQQADWPLRWHWTGYKCTQLQADNVHCTDGTETGVGVDADGPVHDTGTHTKHMYE